MTDCVNIALPKGRLGDTVYGLLDQAGYSCPAVLADGRKLTFENAAAGVRYFWAKPADVPIYVERGAADIGIVGKDILLEYAPDVYELLDLKVGQCRMAVAAKRGFADNTDHTLRVATKFPNIAGRYFAGLGRSIDIIRLSGSIELAPLHGLADVIVDLVQTGRTLKENNLEVVATIMPVSARLIVNKSSFQFNHQRMETLCSRLRGLLEQAEGA